MGLKAGWLALFIFVWIIGAFLGSTFEYHSASGEQGTAYSTGVATFTNGLTTVTGVGTNWVVAMEGGNIKADVDEIWTKIESIDAVNQLTLYSPYTGTGGAGLAYTMAASPGFVGSGTAGYSEAPVTTLQYIFNAKNAIQGTTVLGFIPLPIPNSEYFNAIYRVITWQWSFLDGFEMFYWIFLFPFVAMGLLSIILIIYGALTGNLTL